MARLPEIVKTFVRAFVEHDTDKDGVLTQEEFERMLDNCLNLKAKMPQCDLEQVMKSRDGVIDISEFCARMGEILKCGTKQKKGDCGECTSPLAQALKTTVTLFHEYDTDNDEKLTKDELKELLEKEIDCSSFKRKMLMSQLMNVMEENQCNPDEADIHAFWACVSFIIKRAYEKKKDSD